MTNTPKCIQLNSDGAVRGRVGLVCRWPGVPDARLALVAEDDPVEAAQVIQCARKAS